MTLTIHLPPETEARLRSRAAASGRDVSAYIQHLIAKDVQAEPLEKLLAPLRQQFAESGMTDDELGTLVEEAREEVWQEKLGRKVP